MVCVLLAGSLLTHPLHIASGPELTVEFRGELHPISPQIYGLNDNTGDADAGFAREISAPVSRWGGDWATRYNWKVDASNSGDDFYFIAGSDKPSHRPSGQADAFVRRAALSGSKAILTVPIIDFINSAENYDCSFPVSILGKQEHVNPYVHPVVNGRPTDAGNGRTPDGKPIRLTMAQILRLNIPNQPQIAKDWIAHLRKAFGSAAEGGVAIYQLDNEPSGWSNTHRDVEPDTPTYETIIDKSLRFAQAIKEADPTAQVLGPGDFGWPVYKGSPEKQGGLWNAELYLKRFAEAGNHPSLLDYFDEHYYPVSDEGVAGIANAPAGDAAVQENRLLSTRSLWDPKYIEKNWIGKYNGAIRLIPRMKEWVAKYRPGTKTAITEYNFGGLETMNGALAQADVLGIFGREGLDLATIWGPPKGGQPGAFAFRMYRNYNGLEGRFGDLSVPSSSADQNQISVYSSQRKLDGALTVMVVNKSKFPLESRLNLVGFRPAGLAEVYRYSKTNLKSIIREKDQKVTSSGWSATYPAESISLFVAAKKDR